MVKIHGQSDDLIEVHGEGWADEIGAPDGVEGEGGVIACSDGTMLHVRYDGCWRFAPLAHGTAKYTNVQTTGSDSADRDDGSPGHSDVVILEGDVRWVVGARKSAAVQEPAKWRRRAAR